MNSKPDGLEIIPRERSLRWIVAASLVGLFWVVGLMLGRIGSVFQGLGAELPLRARILFGYGPLVVPLFGVVAAGAWVVSDFYFRGRWVQWLLFAFFGLVVFGICVGAVGPFDIIGDNLSAN